ncbi:AraC family transcriptional regulator [Burkholderia sp. AU4i]|uniref:AraC family transcriptional regulator n=1 Tax=Burkholderia sp. AU4i TaxID=1335308 RepID=UPI00068509D8|nr:AraC family transcriptional regulator [Burkholderia sp. AU4i]
MKTIDITTSKNLVHSYISNYMDVLTDITQTIRLKGGVDFRCEFSAPWGLEMQSGPVARFHIIVHGNCWLKLAGRPEWIQLHAGDLVVLLSGTGHCLVDAPGSNVVSAESVPHPDTPGDFVSVISGGGGLPATVLCGHFEFDREQDNYLLRSLPTLIHLRGTDTYEFEWLQTVHRFIADETLRARSGAVAVIQRLVEVLFIQMLRTYIAKSGPEAGILGAIADKQVGAALNQIHRAPERPWTVETLATEACMSRAAFATRFREMVGQSPMQYVTHRRLYKAAELLVRTQLNIAAIAERVGYESEPALSKAFKRIFGCGPGAYRRDRREGQAQT